MQYLQRRLHRSVTDKRKLRSGRPKTSATGRRAVFVDIWSAKTFSISSERFTFHLLLLTLLGMFLHPNLAFRCMFEFPDRGDSFQFTDRPLAGTERLGPMLGPHDNQHDVVTDIDLAIPVED